MSTLQAFSEKERAYHAYQAQNYLRQQRSLQHHLEALQAQTETLQAEAKRERTAREQERAAKEAERVSREVLSLPVHPFLEEREQDRVVAAVLAAVG